MTTPEEKVRVAAAMKALRERVARTQDAFAARCGIDRTHIIHIEKGRNALTSFAMRAKVAAGIGVSTDALSSYIDGVTSLDELLSAPRAA